MVAFGLPSAPECSNVPETCATFIYAAVTSCFTGMQRFTVGVAQLVRAPGCGPGGRGFDSHRSPSERLYESTAFVFVFGDFFRGVWFFMNCS